MKADREVVLRARDGDILAFEALVDEFRDMAIGYAYSILKDYQHAEDAAQESFARAYFKLNALKDPDAFAAWLRRIVFSQCEHFYRKKRLPSVPLDDAFGFSDPRQGPPEIAERRERVELIAAKLRALPEREQGAAILFYVSGYSMAEIGRFLDLPVGAVKNRLFSARKALRKELAGATGGAFRRRKPDKAFAERVKNMIASGHKQALLVKGDGTVMSWGNLSRYAGSEAASGRARPAAVMGLANVKSIAASAGCYGTYALLGDGTVCAWGWNVFRHLGTGSKEEYIATPEKVQYLDGAVSVAAGVSHALALKGDGTVWAWGRNWYGQQGNGRDGPDGRGFEENGAPARVPGLPRIQQISAGYFHSLALAEDGAAWRWGGYGDSTPNYPIVYASNTPIQIKAPGKIAAISAGGMHDVLLCEDGTAWACGYNTQRQLGTNRVFNEVLDRPVRVGGLSDVKAISAGGSFTLALKADGTVWAWGANESGQLGNGEYDASEMTLNDGKCEPVEVAGLKNVVEIAAGGSHAMAVDADGAVWAWGGNDEGQLGDLAEERRCIPQKIM